MKSIDTKNFLRRGVSKLIVKDSIEKKLRNGKKLRIKHGIDPTMPNLHLGYAVIYEKLRTLQQAGHTIVFIIGDFTGRFGDPTERSKTRPIRSKGEVRGIAKQYIKQLSRILNTKKIEIRYNSEWYDRMEAEEFIRLFSHFTIGRMLERDMFQERIRRHADIRLHEPLYPALQAYDSVKTKSDLTVIGNDQLFNELQARKLQEDFGQTPQDIIAMKILIGTDGRNKMSQSLGNYIGITELPREQYGKIMSIPDDLIVDYFELITRISQGELDRINKIFKDEKTNPMDLKMRLAREIVGAYYSPETAGRVEKEFKRIFQKHVSPDRIQVIKVEEESSAIPELLVRSGLALSKSAAKRLILGGAVKIDGGRVTDWKEKIKIKSNMIVQVGRRHFARIQIK